MEEKKIHHLDSKMMSSSGELTEITVIKINSPRRRRLRIRRTMYTCGDNNNNNMKKEDFSAECNRNELVIEDKKISEGESNTVTEVSLSFSTPVGIEKTGVVISELGDKTRTCVSHGWVSTIGRRREMEDAVTVELEFVVKGNEKFDFFGVYDGHGGAVVAEACRNRLHRVLERESIDEVKGEINWDRVMEDGFERMDEEVTETGKIDRSVKMMGTTAVVAVVGKEVIVVANCGDSRAVISRGGVAIPLSVDHKPDRFDELERIEGAGGRVINWDGHRVLGVLATSRSIGDQYLKPFVISKPEVRTEERSSADEFLILGSDGLWDVVSNETACRVVRKCLKLRRSEIRTDKRAGKAAGILAKLAISRGSKDNISVVVIELNKPSVDYNI